MSPRGRDRSDDDPNDQTTMMGDDTPLASGLRLLDEAIAAHKAGQPVRMALNDEQKAACEEHHAALDSQSLERRLIAGEEVQPQTA